MKGQALAIAMVIVSGVATYVISVSTLDSLRETRAVFYRDYRFAELFVSLKRAPESSSETVRAIPGVDRVETRVTTRSTPGTARTASARLSGARFRETKSSANR